MATRILLIGLLLGSCLAPAGAQSSIGAEAKAGALGGAPAGEAPALRVSELRGRVEVRASSAERFGLGLRLGAGDWQAAGRLGAEGKGEEVAGSLRLGTLRIGSGSAGPALRFLHDPLATSSLLRLGPAVELDPSLEAKTLVCALGLAELGLEAFALAEGAGEASLGGALDGASTAGGADGGEADEAARAGGVVWVLPERGEGPGLCLGSVLSRSPGKKEAEGWKAEAAGRPADFCWTSALSLLRSGRDSSSAFGCALSLPGLSPPGLAFRLESRAYLPAASLALSLAGASPGFRGLFGAEPTGLIGARLEARLSLFSRLRLGLDLGLASPSSRGQPSPFERRAAISLSLSPGAPGLPRIDSEVSIVGSAGEAPTLAGELGLSGSVRGEGQGAQAESWRCSARLERGAEADGVWGLILKASLRGSVLGLCRLGLEAGLAARLKAGAGAGVGAGVGAELGAGPEAGLGAGAGAGVGAGSGAAPISAFSLERGAAPRGFISIDLEFGLGAGGALDLGIDVPAAEVSAGAFLAPDQAGGFVLRLQYTRDFREAGG